MSHCQSACSLSTLRNSGVCQLCQNTTTSTQSDSVVVGPRVTSHACEAVGQPKAVLTVLAGTMNLGAPNPIGSGEELRVEFETEEWA